VKQQRSNLFSLVGKNALITGSSRGIGLTLAEGLGLAGATIILNSRNPERLVPAIDTLSGKGVTVSGYAFDVAKPKEVREQIKRIEEEIGPIHILVNNAGIQIRGRLEEYSSKNWEKILSINLTGVFETSKAVVQGMIERNAGKIINICSMTSELGRPTTAPYATTKGGLKMLTKSMATEWAKYNIQVNGLGPGYFKTEMTRPLYEDTQFNQWLFERVPAERWGDPKELVGAAVFLSSSASDYVNGHILYVDGGMLASM